MGKVELVKAILILSFLLSIRADSEEKNTTVLDPCPIPLQIAKLSENDTYSSDSCIFFFFYENLTLINLNNLEFEDENKTNYKICSRENNGKTTINKTEYYFNVTQGKDIKIIFYNVSIGNTLNITLHCPKEESTKRDIIKTKKACGYVMKFVKFLLDYNYIFGSLLIICSFELAFSGYLQQKLSIVIAMVLFLFSALLGFFQLTEFQMLSTNSNNDVIYFIISFSLILVGLIAGLLVSLNKAATKIFSGCLFGYVSFKMISFLFLYRVLLLNQWVWFSLSAVTTASAGFLFFMLKDDSLPFLLFVSFVGNYYIIKAFDLFVGGWPSEMYIIRVGRYSRTLKEVNQLLNSPIFFIYYFLWVFLVIISFFYQNWRNKQIEMIKESKEKKPKTKRGISILQNSYSIITPQRDLE